MTWNLPSLTEDDAKALLKTKFGKELLWTLRSGT